MVGSIAFDAVKTPVRGAGADARRLRRALLARGELLHRRPRGRARWATTSARTSTPCSHGRGVNTDDIEHVEGGRDLLLAGPLRVRPQPRPTPTTPSSACSASSSPSSPRSPATRTTSSWPTSSPTSSAGCASSARRRALAGLDSMNLWIDTARESLVKTIAGVDLVFLNDAEIRMLTEEPNLVRAAREVMDMGPSVVVAKQGEYGAALVHRRRLLRPARPSRSRPWSTPPAPATPSPADSSATWPPRTTGATTPRCGAP